MPSKTVAVLLLVLIGLLVMAELVSAAPRKKSKFHPYRAGDDEITDENDEEAVREKPRRSSSGRGKKGGKRGGKYRREEPEEPEDDDSLLTNKDVREKEPSEPVTPLDARLKEIKMEYEQKTKQAVADYFKEGGTVEGPAKGEDKGKTTINLHETKSQLLDTLARALMGSMVTSAAPAVMLLAVPGGIGKKTLAVLLAFASGGLLGDVFLHMLPHALGVEHGHSHSHGNEKEDHVHKPHHEKNATLEDHGHHHHHHHHLPAQTTMLLVLGGIVLFFLMESFFGHGHEHQKAPVVEKKKKTKPEEPIKQLSKKKQRKAKLSDSDDDDVSEEFVGVSEQKTEKEQAHRAWLNLLADTTHNFTDGIAIGASFLSSTHTGIRTVLVVLIHEVPHELGDFAVLKNCGWSIGDIVLAQLATAVGNLAGAIAVVLATSYAESAQPYIGPVVAGSFLYVGLVSILSELSHEGSSVFQRILQCLAFAAGVGCLHSVTYAEAYFGVHAH